VHIGYFCSTLKQGGVQSKVAKQTEKQRDFDAAVIEMRKELARKIAAHAQSLGENPTPIPGLALFRRTEPTACFLAAYEPSLSVFV
jgi:hypothetical protein